MKIEEVGYGFTFNAGNYQSERIDCRGQIEEGETASEALQKARHFVLSQRGLSVEAEHLEQRIMRLKRDEREAHSKVAIVINQWRATIERYNELRALLQQHGVDIKPLDSYYLPPSEEDIAQAQEEDEDEDDDNDE